MIHVTLIPGRDYFEREQSYNMRQREWEDRMKPTFITLTSHQQLALVALACLLLVIVSVSFN